MIRAVPKTTQSPRAYKEAFCLRIKTAREAANLTQEEMAAALGIKRDRYSKYEKRSQMPGILLAEFCKVTRHHPWYILTGESGVRSPGQSMTNDRAA